jgi:hypothetical protein
MDQDTSPTDTVSATRAMCKPPDASLWSTHVAKQSMPRVNAHAGIEYRPKSVDPSMRLVKVKKAPWLMAVSEYLLPPPSNWLVVKVAVLKVQLPNPVRVAALDQSPD